MFLKRVASVLPHMLVIPLFGLETTVPENLAIGAIFTVVSLAWSFAGRRTCVLGDMVCIHGDEIHAAVRSPGGPERCWPWQGAAVCAPGNSNGAAAFNGLEGRWAAQGHSAQCELARTGSHAGDGRTSGGRRNERLGVARELKAQQAGGTSRR